MTIRANAWTVTSRERMIDLHAHLMPGVDDGAPDLAAAVEMARAAVAGGVTQIVATPHVSARFRNDPLEFPARVAELQRALDEEALDLRVQTGAELSHTMFHDLPEEALRACGLGGSRWILFEPPMSGPAPFVGRMVDELQARGFGIVIAHPERIAAFQRDIEIVQKLVDRGCLCSVTAGSVSGRFGGAVKRFTGELFARGLVHNLASDAHDAVHRPPALRPMLGAAVQELPELEGWVDWLVEEVPAAILAGATPNGQPPAIGPKRGLLDRLLRR